ncbi:MAG: hypothetical protein AB7F86_00555 [Bdellovibrionales bacterium]
MIFYVLTGPVHAEMTGTTGTPGTGSVAPTGSRPPSAGSLDPIPCSNDRNIDAERQDLITAIRQQVSGRLKLRSEQLKSAKPEGLFDQGAREKFKKARAALTAANGYAQMGRFSERDKKEPFKFTPPKELASTNKGLPTGAAPTAKEQEQYEKDFKEKLAKEKLPDWQKIKKDWEAKHKKKIDGTPQEQIRWKLDVEPFYGMAIAKIRDELKKKATQDYEKLITENPFLAYIKAAEPTDADIADAKRRYEEDLVKKRAGIDDLKPESREARALILVGPVAQAVLKKNPELCGAYNHILSEIKSDEKVRHYLATAIGLGGVGVCTVASFISGPGGAGCFAVTGLAEAAVQSDLAFRANETERVLNSGQQYDLAGREGRKADDAKFSAVLAGTVVLGSAPQALKGLRALKAGAPAAEELATARSLSPTATRLQEPPKLGQKIAIEQEGQLVNGKVVGHTEEGLLKVQTSKRTVAEVNAYDTYQPVPTALDRAPASLKAHEPIVPGEDLTGYVPGKVTTRDETIALLKEEGVRVGPSVKSPGDIRVLPQGDHYYARLARKAEAEGYEMIVTPGKSYQLPDAAAVVDHEQKAMFLFKGRDGRFRSPEKIGEIAHEIDGHILESARASVPSKVSIDVERYAGADVSLSGYGSRQYFRGDEPISHFRGGNLERVLSEGENLRQLHQGYQITKRTREILSDFPAGLQRGFTYDSQAGRATVTFESDTTRYYSAEKLDLFESFGGVRTGEYKLSFQVPPGLTPQRARELTTQYFRDYQRHITRLETLYRRHLGIK